MTTSLTQSPITDSFPSLSDQILAKYALGVFDNPPRSFLPSTYVDELITRPALRDVLLDEEESEEDPDGEELVNFIFDHAKVVFATVVMCGVRRNDLYQAMKRFQEHHFTDQSLPVKEHESKTSPCFKVPLKKREQFWIALNTHAFLRNQFIFLAPIFSKSIFEIKLEPGHILPFTEKSSEPKEGTFSHVYRVKIHDAHRGDLELTVSFLLTKIYNCTFECKSNHYQAFYVAIKEIRDRKLPTENDEASTKSRLDEEWKTEVEALDNLSGLKHPNIIQRIAAIERGPNRYLMFQWADEGSLRDFWERHPTPSLNPAFVKGVIGQLRGLTDALNELHIYRGPGGGSYRHGDLKPENILCFKNDKDETEVGLWKIADMGLAKHHFTDTHLRPETVTKYGTLIYQPPEVHTDKLKRASGKVMGRSRLYDIWSIGCITLELIVWLLYGYEDLKKFNNSIKGLMDQSSAYYTFNEGIARIHPRVTEFMERISKDPRCRKESALNDLLNIVKDRLLVVPLPEPSATTFSRNESSFEGESNNISVTAPPSTPASLAAARAEPPGPCRGTARDFLKRLDTMISKGESDNSYWSQPDGLNSPLPMNGRHTLDASDRRIPRPIARVNEASTKPLLMPHTEAVRQKVCISCPCVNFMNAMTPRSR